MTAQRRHAPVKPWEEVALSILESLIDHDLSPELAAAWLKSIVDYADLIEERPC